jgi:hypothetical protein
VVLVLLVLLEKVLLVLLLLVLLEPVLLELLLVLLLLHGLTWTQGRCRMAWQAP